MANNKSKGNIHEEKATAILVEKGYQILNRNYFGSFGEIDIIAKKDNTIVFVEVKYRKTSKCGYGEEAIDLKKMKKIYFTGMEYVKKNHYWNYSIRFDAIVFLGDKFQWLENILWGDEIGF